MSIARLAHEPIRQHVVGNWLVELLPRNGYQADYVATTPGIGFAFDSQRGQHAFASDRLLPFLAYPNSLAFVPVGCSVFSASSEGGEYLRLVPQDDVLGWGDHQLNNVLDPVATRAAQDLRKRILASADPLLLEEGALEFANAVQAQLKMPVGDASPRWMTPARMHQIDELIAGRLDGPLHVAELADALGLSEGFFSRAFKRATGQSPHRYIIAQRLARARALLRSPHSSLIDIALQCGFSSQAHLTSSFRQHLGITPGLLRQR